MTASTLTVATTALALLVAASNASPRQAHDVGSRPDHELLLTVQSSAPKRPLDKPGAKLNTLQDVFRALSVCWNPPPLEQARPGMEITVLLSFNRAGEILGEPRFTYLTPGVSQEVRATYQRTVADAITRCNPLPFTPSLGNALAGRPLTMRYVDTRGLKKVENRL